MWSPRCCSNNSIAVSNILVGKQPQTPAASAPLNGAPLVATSAVGRLAQAERWLAMQAGGRYPRASTETYADRDLDENRTPPSARRNTANRRSALNPLNASSGKLHLYSIQTSPVPPNTHPMAPARVAARNCQSSSEPPPPLFLPPRLQRPSNTAPKSDWLSLTHRRGRRGRFAGEDEHRLSQQQRAAV